MKKRYSYTVKVEYIEEVGWVILLFPRNGVSEEWAKKDENLNIKKGF